MGTFRSGARVGEAVARVVAPAAAMLAVSVRRCAGDCERRGATNGGVPAGIAAQNATSAQVSICQRGEEIPVPATDAGCKITRGRIASKLSRNHCALRSNLQTDRNKQADVYREAGRLPCEERATNKSKARRNRERSEKGRLNRFVGISWQIFISLMESFESACLCYLHAC
jgi:hypothetical protein